MKYSISFEIEIPDDINPTHQEVLDWVKYQLNIWGHLKLSNPLSKYDDWDELKPIFLRVLQR